LATETVERQETGLPIDLLTHIGTAISTYPKNFNVHSNLSKILKLREKTVREGEGIDWATAESMGFGGLLAEGSHVRLSGQDVERGTFSQRHAVLHEQTTVRKLYSFLFFCFFLFCFALLLLVKGETFRNPYFFF